MVEHLPCMHKALRSALRKEEGEERDTYTQCEYMNELELNYAF